MKQPKILTCLIIAIAAWTFQTQTANACSCAPKRPVLDSFERSDYVLFVRVVSVEKTEDKDYLDGVKSTTAIVEKVFKGDLKVGEKMVFGQGGGADCVWTFDDESVGKQFLFYLSRSRERTKLWFAGTCGRSTLADYAGDDLLYLNNLSKLRGKTRLSGTLSIFQSSPIEGVGYTYKALSDRTVRITGKDKSYELTTNSDGVYEIYDIPAGRYEVKPEIPSGWTLDRFGIGNSSPINFEDLKQPSEQPPTFFSILVQPGSHSYLDFNFNIDNEIRGTVTDLDGIAMANVCVRLEPTPGKKAQYFSKFDCTDKNGAFSIDDIPVGSYVLVVNDDGKISSDEPFPTFYYPNVLEREKAVVITIGEGQTISDLNVRAPSIRETITIEGVVVYSDGKPVANESVEFEPDKPSQVIEDASRTQTDEKGYFALKVLKGTKGRLAGNMFTYVGEFKNCPQLEKIIKAKGGTSVDLNTNEILVEGDRGISNVELKFTFPYCEKAKE